MKTCKIFSSSAANLTLCLCRFVNKSSILHCNIWFSFTLLFTFKALFVHFLLSQIKVHFALKLWVGSWKTKEKLSSLFFFFFSKNVDVSKHLNFFDHFCVFFETLVFAVTQTKSLSVRERYMNRHTLHLFYESRVWVSEPNHSLLIWSLIILTVELWK